MIPSCKFEQIGVAYVTIETIEQTWLFQQVRRGAL